MGSAQFRGFLLRVGDNGVRLAVAHKERKASRSEEDRQEPKGPTAQMIWGDEGGPALSLR